MGGLSGLSHVQPWVGNGSALRDGPCQGRGPSSARRAPRWTAAPPPATPAPSGWGRRACSRSPDTGRRSHTNYTISRLRGFCRPPLHTHPCNGFAPTRFPGPTRLIQRSVRGRRRPPGSCQSLSTMRKPGGGTQQAPRRRVKRIAQGPVGRVPADTCLRACLLACLRPRLHACLHACLCA